MTVLPEAMRTVRNPHQVAATTLCIFWLYSGRFCLRSSPQQVCILMFDIWLQISEHCSRAQEHASGKTIFNVCDLFLADIYGGYLCFVVSILCIGVVTAVIGDVASHFGCTLGIKDSVTAIVFVALGTSIPGNATHVPISLFKRLFTGLIVWYLLSAHYCTIRYVC